ncbi:MAG: biotin--[acetyl-CoA-carboxylase] ligase [Planctomycetaceae bacterium]
MTAVAAYDLERTRREARLAAIEHHLELASTNDRGMARGAEESPPLPLLVLADRQTAGRGRGGNRWWSAEGSAAFSLLTAWPEVSSERRSQVALAAGLAVARAVEDLVPSSVPLLKWPNDVYLLGRKACGILVEVPPRRPGRVVIGIGVNVNNSFSAAPEELQRTAIALCDIAGEDLPLTDVLLAILARLREELESFATDPGGLAERWRTRCLLAGRVVELSHGERTTTGLCAGIDESGALVLDTEAGPQRFIAGTIRSYL